MFLERRRPRWCKASTANEMRLAYIQPPEVWGKLGRRTSPSCIDDNVVGRIAAVARPLGDIIVEPEDEGERMRGVVEEELAEGPLDDIAIGIVDPSEGSAAMPMGIVEPWLEDVPIGIGDPREGFADTPIGTGRPWEGGSDTPLGIEEREEGNDDTPSGTTRPC